MDKTKLVQLKKKLFIRSALISLDNIDELLSLNNYLSADEILLEIFKKALSEYEITCPLIIEMPISSEQVKSCTAPSGFFEIKSNFSLYLRGELPEWMIILVPNSLPKWRIGGMSYGGGGYDNFFGGSGSLPQPGVYTDAIEYRKPYCCLNSGVLTGTFGGDVILKGICSRPVVPDFLPDKTFNPDSENSAIFWMDVENGGARGNYFMDLCLLHLLDFIRQLKASLQLANTPVDVLSNIDNAYQELRVRCDQFAMQSGWYGELIY